MRSIAGIERPDSGKIVVNGTVFFDRAPGKKARVDLSPQQRKTALLFQNYMLFPNLTVEQNVGAGIGRDVPADRRAQLVQAELRRFDVEPFSKRYPAQLSGGEQQRVALARAFNGRPEVLFADEPTGNLDRKTGDRIADLLFSLNREHGTTLILVTHDPQLAARCDRRLRLVNGILQEEA